MLNTTKVLSLIAIVFVALMVQEAMARALSKGTGAQHQHHQHQHRHRHASNKIAMQSGPQYMMNPLLARLLDIEEASLQLIRNDGYHLLRKRHDNSGPVRSEVMNSHTKNAWISSRNKRYEDFDVKVKEAQNNSVCDYKVTPFTDSEDYIVPKDLVNITCKSSGLRCQENGAYYCVQTYTEIQVELRHEKGGTRPMRLNTGCVCALRWYGALEPGLFNSYPEQ